MATDVQTAVVSADRDTLALIQRLVDEKRAALEASSNAISRASTVAATAGGGGSSSSGVSMPTAPPPPPADPASMRDETISGVSQDDERQSVTSSTAHLHRSTEAAQMRAMRLQQEMLLREAEECTFHPRTLSGSGRTKTSQPVAFFQRAQQWQDQITFENEERRKKLDEQAMADCTFTPNVGASNSRRSSWGGVRRESTEGGAAAPPLREKSVVDRLYQPQVRIEHLARARAARAVSRAGTLTPAPSPCHRHIIAHAPSRAL